MDQKLELNIVPRTKVSDLSPGSLTAYPEFSCVNGAIRAKDGYVCPESRVLSLSGGRVVGLGSQFDPDGSYPEKDNIQFLHTISGNSVTL